MPAQGKRAAERVLLRADQSERREQEELARQKKAAQRALVLQAEKKKEANRLQADFVALQVGSVVDWMVKEVERAEKAERAAALQAQRRQAAAAAVARKMDAEVAKEVRKVVMFLKLRTVQTAEA